jgi:hypothetical protein
MAINGDVIDLNRSKELDCDEVIEEAGEDVITVQVESSKPHSE